jgi:hypothetical protein
LEAEKELDVRNTVVGVVGAGTPFTIFEGEALAPFLLGLGAAAPAGALPEAGDEDAMDGAGGEEAAGAAAAGGGGGGPPGMDE